MTSQPPQPLNLPLLASMADLSPMARSFVLADVTVWVAEHGALSADELARFIAEAEAVAGS